MHWGFFLLTLISNLAVIIFLHYFQNKSLEHRVWRLKKEIGDLEDLVTAIIEELETNTEIGPDTKNQPPEVELSAVLTEEAPPQREEILDIAPNDDHQREKILELRRQGRTVNEIARELRMGQGEVNLVLGMYNRS